MKLKLDRWIKAHPTTAACIVTGLSVAGIGVVIVSCALHSLFNEPFDSFDLLWQPFMLASVAAMWIALNKVRKGIVVILAASLLLNPPQMKAALPVAVCVVGILILVGGCVIVKKGKRIARKREFLMTNEQRFVSTGALFTWAEEGNCYEERIVPSTPVVFTLHILVESLSNCTVTVQADAGEEHTESFDEFKRELPTFGLSWPESTQPSSCFAFNGIPCSQEEAGIYFDTKTRTVTRGGADVTVVIERSTDLREWTRLVASDLAIGEDFNLFDLGYEGMAFYRTSITPHE
jgi:hypothetical protein